MFHRLDAKVSRVPPYVFMKADTRGMPFSFVNREIVAKIEDINSRLRALGRPDCAYRLLLTRDVLISLNRGYEYELSLVRQEHGPQQADASTAEQGAVQIICERKIKFLADKDTDIFYPDDMSADSCIFTYEAARSMNDRERYFRKKYASLLIHLSVFCAASARKCMNVMAIHPATAKIYRCYDDWTECDKARWSKEHYSLEFPDEKTAQYTKSYDEARCINAARVGNTSSAKEFAHLAPEAVERLKSEAAQQINHILTLYEENPATYTSGCVSPYIV